MTIRARTADDTVREAREQAEAGHDCSHPFPPGTRHAQLWEQAHAARARELQELEA